MRGRLILTASGLAIAAAACLLVLFVYRAAAPSAGPAGSLPGGPFALEASDGRTITDRDFRGKYMLIYFGYTNCPDACPAALALMSAALDKLGAKAQEVAPVFITIDPERDTATVLKTYLAPFGANIVGLTGPVPTIAAVEREYRVYAVKDPPGPDGSYAMDHSSVIYVMGPDGNFLTAIGDQATPDAIAKELGRIVS